MSYSGARILVKYWTEKIKSFIRPTNAQLNCFKY
jgi:hypothetical protein